ncbi:MAG: hypothetical protein ACKO1M_11400 [Planctomycetota bacterium]
MSKASKKTTEHSPGRSTAKPATAARKTALAAKAAKAVTDAISRSKKGTGKRGKDDDADIHIHVGDVVMMGFDEAVDAEEWGMRETNNELAGRGAGRGKTGKADADGQDDKGRKVRRSITLNKGKLRLQAVERSEPAKKTKAAKKAGKKAARKPAAKKVKRRR